MRHILLSISILSVWMMKVHTNFDDWPIDPRWIHRKKKAKELDTIYIDFDHEQITVFFCFVFMCICFLRTKLYIIENIIFLIRYKTMSFWNKAESNFVFVLLLYFCLFQLQICLSHPNISISMCSFYSFVFIHSSLF